MPSTHHRHPEFGYFCPSPGLRRTAKFALVLILLASMAVASQMVVQIADRDVDTHRAPAIAAVPLDPTPAPTAAVLSPAAPAKSADPRSVSSPRAPAEAAASMTIKPPQTQLIAAPKKAKKTARSQQRRRERDWQDAQDAYAWRPQRADSWEPRGYGHHFWRPGW
jgi:hypothetical protein